MYCTTFCACAQAYHIIICELSRDGVEVILVYDVSDTVVSRRHSTHHQYEHGHEDAGVNRRQHEKRVLL